MARNSGPVVSFSLLWRRITKKSAWIQLKEKERVLRNTKLAFEYEVECCISIRLIKMSPNL
jgi:hypothetical protein